MKRRTFKEMITYFNQTVADMDIARKYKMKLLGMIAAILQKHDEEVQRWIPCSERLPEKGMDILICDIDGDIYLTHMTRYESFYTESGDRIKNIRAWMPLPEPYKEGTE